MQTEFDLVGPPRPVVHCLQERYDVYVGRGPCPRTGIPGEWGNPFSHIKGAIAEHHVKTRAQAVDRHREWFLAQPEMVARAKLELRGKILGCWCLPGLECHGWVLARVANE